MRTTLYAGDRVLACDGVAPPAEALVVRDGRVAAVGARAAIARLAGAGAEQVDVRGATILPGLVDTHPHALDFGAFGESPVDIADARSHDDIVARAATPPPGEWTMTTPVGEPHYFIRANRRFPGLSRRCQVRSAPPLRIEAPAAHRALRRHEGGGRRSMRRAGGRLARGRIARS
jgi:predicted amidohydrolase YtcJ